MKKLIAIFAFILISCSAIAEEKSVLVVSGSGEIEAKPDFVTIFANLNSRDKNIKTAKKKNDDNYQQILKTLTEKLEIKKSDIKSNSVSINPVYQTCKDGNGNWIQCEKQTIDYYDVNRSLQFKVTNLENYDAVISTIAEAGFATVSSGQFGVTEMTELKDKVRDMAIDAAKSKAKKIASKLEVTLKKPIRYDGSDDGASPPIYYANAKMERAMASDAAVQTDTETLGMIKLTANVTITYEIE